MKNEKLLKFLDKLEALGVNTNAYHWVPRHVKKIRPAKYLVQKLYKDLGEFGNVIKLERCCSQASCVNPFHYRCVRVQDLRIGEEQAAEIEDIKEMIDLDTLNVIGFGPYLEKFNENNPLPAKPLDFFLACNRALKDHHQMLLDWSVYREGNYED